MGSAKIIIKEHDNSGYVPSFQGVYGGMVHPARKGKVGVPVITTSESDFIAKRGLPDPRLGSFAYEAFAFFTQSDKMWSVRMTHTNSATKPDGTFIRDDATLASEIRYKGEARYSAALVRAVIAQPDTVSVDAVYSDESMVVKPLALGLVQDELDAYNFPEYIGTRTYKAQAENVLIKYPVTAGTKLYVSDTTALPEGQMFSVYNGGAIPAFIAPTLPVVTVLSAGTEDLNYEVLTLDTTATALAGEELFKKVNNAGVITYESYQIHPTLIIGVDGSNQLFVTNTDFFADGDIIVIGANHTKEYTVVSKDIVPVTEQFIIVDKALTVTPSDMIFKVTHYEIEQRDAMLVLCESQGLWGNKISIGIEKSKNFEGAFHVIVYENGAEVERWENCSRTSQLDGYQKQMFVEDRINGKSAYIQVLDNSLLEDSYVPLETSASYWRENAVDIFIDSGVTTVETVNASDLYIKVNATLPIGTRIKFGTYSDEYKVSNIVNGQLVLDRPFIPSKIPVGTKINKYDHTETKPITKLSESKAGVVIGATYTLGTKIGKILDAGANFTYGGDDGQALTVYDLMLGYDRFANREDIPVTLLMDGGFAHPALAQKMVQIAEKRDDCFVYLSMDPDAEDARDYTSAIVNYRNSLNLNTSYGSLFTGWVEVADPYNQKNVWISPVGFAMASQSYTAGTLAMWHPAAGWKNGGLKALRVKRAFSEAERDIFVDNQICPIRYKNGAGLSIWGNETLLTLPSVLQSRHVRMLLIVIKDGLRKYLEGKIYDLNTERGRTMIEAAINAYMRDEIGDGVYGYTVAVNGYTTGSDIANKRVKIFLGIQPTLEMKEFQVDLTLFNANQKIEIA